MSLSRVTQAVSQQAESSSLVNEYRVVRYESENLCKPLMVEDYCIQTMPDVSPPKWHLAHTSWFFETFILKSFVKNYSVFASEFEYLFNSYYEQVGQMHPRPERGLLSRPSVERIYAYRHKIDEAMCELLVDDHHSERSEILRRTEIGLHHEQQHQELLLTDIKHIFAYNPLKPAYTNLAQPPSFPAGKRLWHEQADGLYPIGFSGDSFAFDNEGPPHKVYLEPYRIASRLTTNEEFMAFIDAGGYQNSAYWLSDGWKTVQTQKWERPIYWQVDTHQWFEFTLAGLRPLDLNAPVTHISFYEANAYANWLDKRLATEMEWEVMAGPLDITGNFRESGFLQPMASDQPEYAQFYGDVWEWTQSSYSPYPGYKAVPGALGEYNGKFMSSQFVLRGGSCVTPEDHIRSSYRNFFYPADRWQYSGIRLAETL